MIKKRTILLSLITILIGAGIFAAQETLKKAQDSPLRSMESELDLDNELQHSFHSILENKERNGLRFPGYIVGIEKTDEEHLGRAPSLGHLGGLDSAGKYNTVREAANDKGKLFLSHIVEYAGSSTPIVRIKTNILYSAYSEDNFKQTERYSLGVSALNAFSDTLIQQINRESITHLFVLTMGWNTPQLEAIGDFNGIMGNLYDLASTKSDKPFKPLVIGVTWPSTSTLSTAFYLSKAYDADELGTVWINHLLQEIRQAREKTKDLHVTLLGHSLGARAMTTGIFAYKGDHPEHKAPADILIGYAGAFSINRFIPDAGIEGTPYSDFKSTGMRLVYTWSDADMAGKVSKFILTPHINGPGSSDIAKQHPELFRSFEVPASGNLAGVAMNDPLIYHFDTSKLMKYKSFEASGGAHSDIFRPETSRFLWFLISTTKGQQP